MTIHKRIRIIYTVAIPIALAIAFTGCGKSEPPSSSAPNGSPAADASASAGSSQASPLQQEAQAAVMADLAKHWTQGPDGWTTALTGGSPGAPEHFLRQAKELTIQSIDSSDLSDADKLNGVQWTGSVSLKPLTMREAGDPDQVAEGMSDPPANRQRGQWSIWVQYTPYAMSLQKTNGQWQITGGGTLRAGTPPAPDDYANAGVK